MKRWHIVLALVGATALGTIALPGALPAQEERASQTRRFPDIVLITVDTLRQDRLSIYGYKRPTSPNIDRLLAGGARYTEARVVEPLTAPSMVSMVTSLHPHEHGTSRNGLRMRPGLDSLTKPLRRRGYRNAAFVANWTLRDEISGLSEHFDHYQEVFTRNRWYVFAREADADDVTGEALKWLEEHMSQPQRWPYLLWVHYVEPHAPYRLHKEFREPLGITERSPDASDRYDTEVAFVDRSIGELLEGVYERSGARNTLVVFLSDHGESLGEHNYWGHGRNLYEPGLLVPMGLTWTGRIAADTVFDAPASSLDLAPTVLGLLGLPIPGSFKGFNWAPVMAGEVSPPTDRITFHQAHKGAVKGDGRNARRRGLLEVGLVSGGRKETVRVRGARQLYDLNADPRERRNLAKGKSEPGSALQEWLATVRKGLVRSDELPAPVLDEEDLEKLRALGYID